ncbi:ABC transporter ATP-binding protein [Zavarzinella formosa]|uniref:ABC transporter ATP-binding protein n=1 Tax=Zavarzinella formosa TaxID=360055 RepID=UPI00031B7DA5|nr:ABC transporter ATP-binding protein [Zavarzinella formosa]
MITLDSLSKTFGRTPVLEPTTLNIAAGELFVLLGPSGSGKSTLLRLIAGLETPTSGKIFLDGREVTQTPPHERNIALVSQRPALAPALNVGDNLAQGLRFAQSRVSRRERLSEGEIAARVREAAELLELTPLLNRPADDLSGGEQQRVSLGRAMVRRASIWLLDEPFGSLDTLLAEKLSLGLHLLRERLRLTIIFVTHNPNEAMSLADRVGVLGGGRLLQAGFPAETYDRPGHRAVACLFGQPTINFIDGSVDGGIFSTVSGSLRLSAPFPAGNMSLGVRPEDLSLTPGNGRLSLGEFTLKERRRRGSGWLAAVERGDVSLQVLSADDPPGVGDPVVVWMAPGKTHWFDGDTGWRRET